MILPGEMESRIASFPKKYMGNFNYVWKPKIRAEEKQSCHILDEGHRREFYNRLCVILPKWQTYRNGDNSEPLKTLKQSLDNISEAYNQIRNYTLLDFDDIPREPLEIIWHELGRVKERYGERNEDGDYSVIAVCKPLLLLWGQTLAFDSNVRAHLPRNYDTSKHFRRWSMKNWIYVMQNVSNGLNNNPELIKFIRKESEKRYGKEAIVPYGRFLDIHYWVGPNNP